MEKDSTAGIDFYPGTGEYETVCRPKQPQTAYMGTAVHRQPLPSMFNVIDVDVVLLHQLSMPTNCLISRPFNTSLTAAVPM